MLYEQELDSPVVNAKSDDRYYQPNGEGPSVEKCQESQLGHQGKFEINFKLALLKVLVGLILSDEDASIKYSVTFCEDPSSFVVLVDRVQGEQDCDGSDKRVESEDRYHIRDQVVDFWSVRIDEEHGHWHEGSAYKERDCLLHHEAARNSRDCESSLFLGDIVHKVGETEVDRSNPHRAQVRIELVKTGISLLDLEVTQDQNQGESNPEQHHSDQIPNEYPDDPRVRGDFQVSP